MTSFYDVIAGCRWEREREREGSKLDAATQTYLDFDCGSGSRYGASSILNVWNIMAHCMNYLRSTPRVDGDEPPHRKTIAMVAVW